MFGSGPRSHTSPSRSYTFTTPLGCTSTVSFHVLGPSAPLRWSRYRLTSCRAAAHCSAGSAMWSTWRRASWISVSATSVLVLAERLTRPLDDPGHGRYPAILEPGRVGVRIVEGQQPPGQLLQPVRTLRLLDEQRHVGQPVRDVVLAHQLPPRPAVLAVAVHPPRAALVLGEVHALRGVDSALGAFPLDPRCVRRLRVKAVELVGLALPFELILGRAENKRVVPVGELLVRLGLLGCVAFLAEVEVVESVLGVGERLLRFLGRVLAPVGGGHQNSSRWSARIGRPVNSLNRAVSSAAIAARIAAPRRVVAISRNSLGGSPSAWNDAVSIASARIRIRPAVSAHCRANAAYVVASAIRHHRYRPATRSGASPSSRPGREPPAATGPRLP